MPPTNVYIIGAQCTGKTTLVNALRSSFKTTSDISPPTIVEEVARSVQRVHKFTAADITSSPDRCLALQTLILETQRDAERAALRDQQWIISDRSGLDPIVYAQRYLGHETADAMLASTAWQELRWRMSTSLILVCEAGTNWLVDDGVRLMPQDRDDWIGVHREFCQVLEIVGLPYDVIPCTLARIDDRTAFVWSKWRAAALRDSHGPMLEANGCS
ncbi:AAA domain-containing protein [Ilyonectria robusta]|uniref:AAA domain-containing protein n=1 Tax=Ilyonectria robusta TaxID=1079257 RepID=UPI001E8D02FC|nr:AAA domain-containing protein [Ilyonectria robusta]KAH8685276.1 AAA domain-containing protein [Ilyonectria robusta]